MIGNKVSVNGQIGTVVDFGESLNGKVVLVDLENGEKVKAFASDVEIVTEEREKPEKNKEKTVLIDKKSFMKLVNEKASALSRNDQAIELIYNLFGSILALELFDKTADND